MGQIGHVYITGRLQLKYLMMKTLCALTISLYLTCCVAGTTDEDLSSPCPTFVAFSVGKTTFQSGHSRVTYDRVYVNIGNGFSKTDNAFTAPVPGLYQFNFGGLNVKGEAEELFLDLFKNGEYQASVFEDHSYYGQAQNTVLLELLKGDSMYVEMRKSDSGLFGKPDQVYATFSGHLIVPIYRVTTYIGGAQNYGTCP